MRHDSRQRNYYLRRAALMIVQDGICPCGDDLFGPLEIDHDHTCCPVSRADRACGKCDRALMHAGCNAAISRVRENAERLGNLAAYLTTCHLKDIRR